MCIMNSNSQKLQSYDSTKKKHMTTQQQQHTTTTHNNNNNKGHNNKVSQNEIFPKRHPGPHPSL